MREIIGKKLCPHGTDIEFLPAGSRPEITSSDIAISVASVSMGYDALMASCADSSISGHRVCRWAISRGANLWGQRKGFDEAVIRSIGLVAYIEWRSPGGVPQKSEKRIKGSGPRSYRNLTWTHDRRRSMVNMAAKDFFTDARPVSLWRWRFNLNSIYMEILKELDEAEKMAAKEAQIILYGDY